MSYAQNNPWVREIEAGIEAGLGADAEATYFYMDTKLAPAGGPAKAKAALALYREMRPDGVITADDNAQSMFVVPFLKDQEATPVMFCGVNAEPSKYGFPASNVSGILERGHVRETIAYVRQLAPDIRNIHFVTRISPSGSALQRQIEAEKARYSANIGGFHLVGTTEQMKQVVADLDPVRDAVFIDSLEGIIDSDGMALNNLQLLSILSKEFKGAIVGANRYHVEQGVLTAVVKTGQEQGRTAAEMLMRAMRGSAVKDLPVTRNYRGKRIINVSTLQRLQLKPRPIDLRGASLVRTQN